MPLHDWAELTGWDGVHQFWIVELVYALKPLLPPGYRVTIGASPTFVAAPPGRARPDVGVRDWSPGGPPDGDADLDEVVVIATLLTPDMAVLVERAGRLVAVIELVSPRNKDRHDARDNYGGVVYAGYLRRGVHLLLVDVHRRPAGFSFASRIAESVGLPPPELSAPFAVGYRVGSPGKDGSYVGMQRRPLAVGDPLPTMRLPLSDSESVPVDLEATYRRAAEAAYLD